MSDSIVEKTKSGYQKYKQWILGFVFLTVTSISIAALVISLRPPKEYTETLFTSSINTATFSPTTKKELLYSYPLNSGLGSNSGFFTVVMSSPGNIPNITFDVEDNLNRSIIQGTPAVGQTTKVYFQGKDTSTVINLYINTTSSLIQLKSLSINLNR